MHGEVVYEADYLVDEARLGKQAEEFLSSPLGRSIVNRTKAEIQGLMTELYYSDPTDKRAQQNIRLDIKARILMIDILFDQIASGENSTQEIEDYG